MHNIIFGTPIWEYQLDNYEWLNQKLIKETMGFKTGMNLFDMQGEGIKSLKHAVKIYADQIAIQYKWRNLPTSIHGRQNPIFTYGSDTPHFHMGSKLVAIYYVCVPPNSGDILLHDPRGYTNWDDPNVRTEDTGKSCRAYHRVTPKEGMLLMHPSYLVHSVETNLSPEMRLSIAMSITE